MNQSTINGVFQCPLLNQYCDNTELIFASGPLLTICTMYPNMTLSIIGVNTTSTSTTLENAWQDPTRRRAFEQLSIISTGLLSFCAMVPECSQSAMCSIVSLTNIDGQLSRQGIAGCWDEICNTYVASINPDFGGLGMILSYLIQTSIAILGLAAIAIPFFIKRRCSKWKSPPTVQNTQPRHSQSSLNTSSTTSPFSSS